jgi:hypothetical protein
VLGAGQGLHNPIPEDDEWLSEHVIDVFNDMFRAYERDRDLIPDGRLVEITYETLVADPKAVLGEVYRTLGLGVSPERKPRSTPISRIGATIGATTMI